VVRTETLNPSPTEAGVVAITTPVVTQTLYSVGTDPVTGHNIQTITGRQETRIDQLGRATEYFYDAAGRLTDVYLPPVDDALTVSTELVRPHWLSRGAHNGSSALLMIGSAAGLK
jgi:YD repeat-containing protein